MNSEQQERALALDTATAINVPLIEQDTRTSTWAAMAQQAGHHKTPSRDSKSARKNVPATDHSLRRFVF